MSIINQDQYIQYSYLKVCRAPAVAINRANISKNYQSVRHTDRHLITSVRSVWLCTRSGAARNSSLWDGDGESSSSVPFASTVAQIEDRCPKYPTNQPWADLIGPVLAHVLT